MKLKDVLALGFVLASFSVHAIPPAPPAAIYNKIKLVAARNCVTEDGIKVADLRNTETVTFVLELNKDGSAGVLNVFENDQLTDNFKVNCK